MKHLALVLVGLVVLAGCLSSSDPAGDVEDDLPTESASEIVPVNKTYSGTINGAGTPAGGVNDGTSDTTQTISVEDNATSIEIGVTVDAPPEMTVDVGFDCTTEDQGGQETVTCQEYQTATADSHVSWSAENVTEDFDIAFFWDTGAGEASWEAEVTQHVRQEVATSET